MLIDCGDLREKYGPLMKMNDAYDWAANAVRCYDQVVETLCEQHLDERSRARPQNNGRQSP